MPPADDPAAALRQRAATLADLGRNQDALTTLRQAIAADQGSATAWCQLANVHLRLGDPSAALTAADTALGLEESEWAFRLRSAALRRLRRTTQAQRAAEEAVRLAPQEPLTHVCMSSALQAFGRMDAALRAAETAVTLDPSSVTALLNLGNLERDTHHPASAEQAYRRVLAIDPSHSRALNGLGNACMDRADWRGALRWYTAAAKAAPGDPVPMHNIAAVMINSGASMIGQGTPMVLFRLPAIGLLLLTVVLVERGIRFLLLQPHLRRHVPPAARRALRTEVRAHASIAPPAVLLLFGIAFFGAAVSDAAAGRGGPRNTATGSIGLIVAVWAVGIIVLRLWTRFRRQRMPAGLSSLIRLESTGVD